MQPTAVNQPSAKSVPVARRKAVTGAADDKLSMPEWFSYQTANGSQ